MSATSTGAVRNAYLANSIQTGSTAEVEQLGGGFDRWLAGVEREAAAKAIADAADEWTRGAWVDTPRKTDRVADRMAASQFAGDWLRSRAAEYREGKR